MSDNSIGAVEIFDGAAFIPGVNALVLTTSSADKFEDPKDSIPFGLSRVVPWGDNNDLPEVVKSCVEKSEVLSSGMLFNTSVLYGQGIKPMLKKADGSGFKLVECDNDEVNQFFEDNDVQGYFLEQCTDMAWFHNVFPEIIVSANKNKIVSLRSKEAAYSRWGVVNDYGNITQHFYSAKWGDGANTNNTAVSKVLERYNPYLDLTERLKKSTADRFIIPISFPSPGRVYYQRAPWWSVFKSGWYDYSLMIPEFKKALLKNGLILRYIIYVSDKYWEALFKEKGIPVNDAEKVKKAKQEEMTRFQTFLSQEKGAGKGMVATKKLVQSASSAFEEKWIEVVTLPVEIKGGEFIEDSEEVSNIMSYAMGVHPSLIGSTPGKNKGSFSGTDKRELFLIKSAMMKPFRDRLIRPFQLIKRFNKWPNELVFTVPEMEFTTLDANKTGKQEVTNGTN